MSYIENSHMVRYCIGLRLMKCRTMTALLLPGEGCATSLRKFAHSIRTAKHFVLFKEPPWQAPSSLYFPIANAHFRSKIWSCFRACWLLSVVSRLAFHLHRGTPLLHSDVLLQVVRQTVG